MKSITVDQIVNKLNELLYADSIAINSIFSYRVNVNNQLADNCLVTIDQKAGILGILNSFFPLDEDQMGQIKAVFDLNTKSIIKFVGSK